MSGVEKLTRSSLKGLSNRALFAYKSGRFTRRFLLLGIGRIFRSLEKGKFVIQKSLSQTYLNRTGSVFALPKMRRVTVASPHHAPPPHKKGPIHMLPAIPFVNPPLHMSKDGSIWQLFVLCLLALGDAIPKCYLL